MGNVSPRVVRYLDVTDGQKAARKVCDSFLYTANLHMDAIYGTAAPPRLKIHEEYEQCLKYVNENPQKYQGRDIIVPSCPQP